MAIVNGKKILDLLFFKEIGKRNYIAFRFFREHRQNVMWFLCVEPTEHIPVYEQRFHYCSPVSQPVFIDCSNADHFNPYTSGGYTPSSWKKLPEDWKKMFLDSFLQDELDLLEESRKNRKKKVTA